ncbi:MAG: hypothetical protein A2Z03_00600 [Chloroflexi bacterium RBG_16_56_8]|nr:MAG: hypothetical protein A2Z03_00600 [Chloroflexi bacterium RBG_16_56_8]
MHALRSPLDDLMDLMRELALYEHKYRMHSDEFFAKYSQGKLSDDKDFVLWAGEYQVFRDYKSKFEQQWGKLHAA